MHRRERKNKYSYAFISVGTEEDGDTFIKDIKKLTMDGETLAARWSRKAIPSAPEQPNQVCNAESGEIHEWHPIEGKKTPQLRTPLRHRRSPHRGNGRWEVQRKPPQRHPPSTSRTRLMYTSTRGAHGGAAPATTRSRWENAWGACSPPPLRMRQMNPHSHSKTHGSMVDRTG